MKRHVSLAALSAIVGSLPAMAANPPMPSYDLSLFCHGAEDEHSCTNEQYVLRSIVSREWVKTAPEVRIECVAVNRWNDYGLLWSCMRAHENDSKVLK